MSGKKNWENEEFADGVMSATFGVIVVGSDWGLVSKDDKNMYPLFLCAQSEKCLWACAPQTSRRKTQDQMFFGVEGNKLCKWI